MFVSGFIMSSMAISDPSAKISIITIFGLILLTYAISITLFLQVITTQFSENFIFGDAFALIKAVKFLYKNMTAYLKVFGIALLTLIATIVISSLAGSILGFVLFPVLKNYFINIKILFSILSLIIATPLIVYLSTVTTNLYAQVYRLGSVTEDKALTPVITETQPTEQEEI
jgi:hypothetical protein